MNSLKPKKCRLGFRILSAGYAFFLVISLGLPQTARAEMTVGGEFEFVDPNVPVVPGSGLKGHEQGMARRLSAMISTQCHAPKCREILEMGKWGLESRFEYGDKFWFQISWDPNVVEILTKPLPVSELRTLAPEIQKLVFETAKEAGLVPDPAHRAGHFNFGALASFENKSAEFLKFVIDFANHPELSSGILRETNKFNSPSLSILDRSQRQALSGIAIDVKNKGNYAKLSLPEMSQVLLENVFSRTARPTPDVLDAYHYQSLGLKKVPLSRAGKDQPAEIRSVRSQRDIWDFLLLAELIQGRIEYLKTLPLETSLLVTETSRSEFSNKELLNRFYIYVVEAGISWERQARLLPESINNEKIESFFLEKPHWQTVGAAENILPYLDLLPTSPWLKDRVLKAMANPATSESARKVMSEALEKLSMNTNYSAKARNEWFRISEGIKQTPVVGAGSCRQLFMH